MSLSQEAKRDLTIIWPNISHFKQLPSAAESECDSAWEGGEMLGLRCCFIGNFLTFYDNLLEIIQASNILVNFKQPAFDC